MGTKVIKIRFMDCTYNLYCLSETLLDLRYNKTYNYVIQNVKNVYLDAVWLQDESSVVILQPNIYQAWELAMDFCWKKKMHKMKVLL